MPVLEEALYSRLSGYAGLTALVGTRIYPMRAPEAAALPLVVFQRIGTERLSAMGLDTGLAIALMQIVGWAATPVGAKDVKEQLRGALQRWRGTVAGVEVQDSYLDLELDRFDGETKAHGVQLDARIPYREV